MKGTSTSSKRRRLIAVGGVIAALVILGSAVLVGSGAIFTSTSANPANVFTSGILTQSNDKDGAAILSASLMKPGDVVTGQVSIENTGNLSGDFSLGMAVLADAAGLNGGHLLDILTLKIEDGATVVYDADLADFSLASLGTYAPSDSHTYLFTVTFPDGGTPASDTTGDNAYQGSSVTVEFDWTAVQL